eukprot:Phypoly_transcript_03663.p1 GENE.Phypoly_transcript_03663~~Phypoly_transcript_03663.p1  ORF type:complete len:665 (+),score=125.19 Phypoly_transcript_03663:141-2135(+)
MSSVTSISPIADPPSTSLAPPPHIITPPLTHTPSIGRIPALPSSLTSSSSWKHSRHYLDVYHLTQLGVAMRIPSNVVLDEDGFGVKSGPQGFMVYCKDLESMTTLPSLPVNHHRHSQPTTKPSQTPSAPDSPMPSPSLPILRSESLPAESSGSPHSARQSSPAPLGHSSQGGGLPRDKTPAGIGAFHHFRGSDKISNRKSTPEFDRKTPNTTNTGGGSNDGSMKSKKQTTKGKSGRKKSDNDRMARKEEKRRRAHGPPIVIHSIEDFPEEAQKLIKKTKIPDQQLLENLSVIVHIIRFRTGFNVRTEEEMAKSKEEKGTATDEKAGVEELRELTITRPLLAESTGGGSENIQDLANSAASTKEGTNASRQKEKDDFDSDTLDPSIIPRGGEDLLSEVPDIKKLYKNLQQAGRGGFGSVFVAKSTQDKCDIAIKKLPHTTKKMKRTNFNEIGFLNSCKHSNIVKYYRSHLIEDEIWVVMEYMQGGTLAEAVERYSFAESSVAYVAREMLRALEYLHSHNLVHRDLKSANVMLTVEGKIKLIDFGLCVDFTQRKLCHMAGSPFWMPPEMILGIPHGTPADMWSFAICLLELANGEPPNRKSPVRVCLFIIFCMKLRVALLSCEILRRGVHEGLLCTKKKRKKKEKKKTKRKKEKVCDDWSVTWLPP